MSVDALFAPTEERPIIKPGGAEGPNPYASMQTYVSPQTISSAESPTLQHVVNLPEGYGSETASTAGHYHDVAIDGQRRPLLRAHDVHRFIGNEYPGRAAPDYGDLMLEITLPNGGDITAPDEVRARDRFNNTMYVFRRNTNDGPEYTILSPSTLYDATVRPETAEVSDAILRLNGSSIPTVVGTDRGCWMPVVGHDTALLEDTRKMQGGRRTVSRVQGTFYVDRRGNLHYAESATKNLSDLRLQKTPQEKRTDEEMARLTKSIDASYPGRLATRQLVADETNYSSRHRGLDAAIEPQDFVSSGSTQRTFGGHLVGERYTGSHRRQGWLGRLATRFFQ